MNVKFLPASDIEASASELLNAYSVRFGAVNCPPVPVEEILESLLELQLEFADLPKLLNIPDAIGATWIKQRRVVIDQSLDPTVYPKMEGRYRFTVGHELGHWQLHRHLFKDAEHPALFDGTPAPNIVCRSSQREPIEFQADSFSSYLLMPTALLRSAWQCRFGNLEPYVVKKEIAELKSRFHTGSPTVRVARELAQEFKVSGLAMQIRLEGMKLVLTNAPELDLFTGR